MHSEDQRPNDLIYGLDDPSDPNLGRSALEAMHATIGELMARCSASASTCHT